MVRTTLEPAIDQTFPTDWVDALARRETYNRHLYRPNAYLHKWWARRCGTTFRAILKALAGKVHPEEYFEPGGLEGKIILDPMMGSGTTLFEAVRLGASVIGVDIGLLPVLMVRAGLAAPDPQRFAAAAFSLLRQLEAELGSLFQTGCPSCARTVPLRFVLYGRVRRCHCREVIVVDSRVLREGSAGEEVVLEADGSVVSARGLRLPPVIPPAGPVVARTEADRCPECGAPFEDPKDVPYWRRYRPLVVSGHCPGHGLFFKPVDASDLRRISDADERRPDVGYGWEIPRGPKSDDLLRAGIRRYDELYSSRQLLVMMRAAKLAGAETAEGVRLNLGLMVSAAADFNSLLAGYKGWHRGRPGAVRHVFAHHAYSIPYTALENNLLYPAAESGTLRMLIRRRLTGLHYADCPWEHAPNGRRIPVAETARAELVSTFEELTAGPRRALVLHRSAASLPEIPAGVVDAVVTDPPYFDNVQYGDLARYFQPWLRLAFGEAKESPEEALEAASNDWMAYAHLLGRIFAECNRVLKRPHGRLVFTFHHWRAEAWAALSLALRAGGFVPAALYIIHAENEASVHINGQRSLRHDLLLVLKPLDAAAGRRAAARYGGATGDFSRDWVGRCAQALEAFFDEELRDPDAVLEFWKARLA